MKWITSKFSRKLFIALGAVIAVFALSGFWMVQKVRNQLVRDLRENLLARARQLSLSLPSDNLSEFEPELQSLIRSIEGDTGARVTLIRADGTVTADSEVPWDQVPGVENHLDRPEILEARRNGFGFDVRHSHTVDQDMLYAALSRGAPGESAPFIRMAIPLTRVHNQIHAFSHMIWVSSLGAILLSLFLIVVFSRWVTYPLEEISQAAWEISKGKTELRVPVRTEDEVGRLAFSFNQMVEKLDKTLREVQSERDEISAILSGMVEQVVTVDAQGKVLFANVAAEKLFGVRSREVVGRPFVEVVRHASICDVLNGVLEKRSEKSCELRLFLNEERFFEVRAIPLKSGETYRGALLVLHDRTQIQKLEQVRKDFIANVSHELRTPLTSIQGFSETLLDGGLEDQKNNRSFVESIYNESVRLSNLVNDLLDLSSIESGKTKPKMSLFPLRELAQKVEAQLASAAKKTGVSVRNRIPPGLAVRADPGQMKQVFLNLVDNAIKFNKKGGEVFLDAAEVPGGVQITVRDTGSGIPAQDVPRVFERFYRVDKARSRELGGTGLGLAIVKHIIEAHGGAISVQSVEWEGSEFILMIPD